MINYIAIDPGKNGGIAYIEDEQVRTLPMPEDLGEICSFFNEQRMKNKDITLVIEDIPKFVRFIPGSAVAVMFYNYGYMCGAAQMARCKIVKVPPQKWQKDFSLGTKGDMTDSQWKNKLKAEASRLYPTIDNLTLKTSDALLILEYARRNNL
jgi:hypothetical protein